MTKEFTQWNTQKEHIHTEGVRKFYHVREIWWCSLGVNVGYEQDGSGEEYRRPVLILKGLSQDTCLIIPLTTSTQKHFLRPSIGTVGGKEAHALLSQIRVIDTRRLVRKIEYLDIEMFEIIRKTARDML
jgi:mRNA-degrading endonuclease toxin of MazEF toxin-antitoxin module